MPFRFLLFLLLSGLLLPTFSPLHAQRSLTGERFRRLSSVPLECYGTTTPTLYRIVHTPNGGSEFLLQTAVKHYRLSLRAYASDRTSSRVWDYSEELRTAPMATSAVAMPVKLPKYWVEILMTDLDAHTVVVHDVITADRQPRGDYGAQNYTLLDNSGAPLAANYVLQRESIRIQYPDSTVQRFYVRYFKQTYSPAPPPFVDKEMKFNPRGASAETTIVRRGEPFSLDRAGLYFIQTDTLAPVGAWVSVFSDDYPRLTASAELVEAIRYITNKKEYNTLTAATDTKKALDRFWLDLGFKEERARELLKTYYTRVQTANRYFCSYKEGWKTDRGLIFVIFGKPDKIERNDEEEYWYYESTRARPTAAFHFRYKNGQYLLERNASFGVAWDVEVEKWRTGKVY